MAEALRSARRTLTGEGPGGQREELKDHADPRELWAGMAAGVSQIGLRG